MKLAIMQPYFFPYIGYFQLIQAVDKFVVYDDVNFITRGWINRNKILTQNSSHLFSVPLTDASQNKLISDISIVNENKWKKKFLKTIEYSYKQAPFFDPIFDLLQTLILNDENKLSNYIVSSLITLIDYLKIDTEIVVSSSIFDNKHLKGQNRILDICYKTNSKTYINPIGGIELYDQELFQQNDVKLYFLKSIDFTYKQFHSNFVPNLSIIDILMFNSIDKIGNHLSKYELI